METQQYALLKQAYTIENLTKISGQLLLLYKNKHYDRLRTLLRIVHDPEAETATNRQLLSRLMMRYHPDRFTFYQHILQGKEENEMRLVEIDHILILQEAKELFGYSIENDTTFGTEAVQEEYLWEDEDRPTDNWIMDDNLETDAYYGEYDNTLFNVFKRNIYGRQDIELPVFLLEDIEELELSNRGIDNLEGISYFNQLQLLDLSGNAITNLEGIENLVEIKEIYAADNEIGYIDSVGYLEQLRIIDVSGNCIDDLSALFGLTHLEFVNVTGNPVPTHQIEKLKAKGCLVIS